MRSPPTRPSRLFPLPFHFEVWESTKNQDEPGIADYLLMAWSFVCVGVAALPIGFMTACTGAVHVLNRQKQWSTVFRCVSMAYPRMWPLWIYSWMDGWITVCQIAHRLPKNNRNSGSRALSEAMYYAWKVGTIGFIPSIVCGRGVIDACKLSLSFLRTRLYDIACLRFGYSAVCWIVGVCTYVAVFFSLMYFDSFLPNKLEAGVYKFYLIAGIPIVIAVAVIHLFVRPLFILVLFDLYTEFLADRKYPIVIERPRSGVLAVLVVYGLIIFTLGIVYLYRHELGIMKLLSIPLPQKPA
jgi:hypothetical protein